MLVLLRFIFFTLNTIINLISRAIFSFFAYSIVSLIRLFQAIPKEINNGVIEYVAKAIKSTLEFLVQLIIGILVNVISKMVELITDKVTELISSGVGSIAELIENTKDSLQVSVSIVSETLQGLSEMVATIASDVWSNFVQAIGYVKDNA